MEFNRTTITWLVIGFIWCIFMGVTAISIGFGSLYPAMNDVAKPFVCMNGKLTVDQYVYRPRPGTTYTTTTWTCTDARTEKQRKIDPLEISLYAGPFYGVLLFVLICFGLYIYPKLLAIPIIARNSQWIGGAIVILIIVLITWWNLAPIFSGVFQSATPTP